MIVKMVKTKINKTTRKSVFLLVKFRLTFTTNARRLLGQLELIKLAFSDVLVAVLKQLESQ